MEQEIDDKQDADRSDSSRVKPENKQEAQQVRPIKQTTVFSKSRITQLQEQHFIVSTKECGRFYCRVCNVTFDSLTEEKVKQHISGKGHRKNVKSKGMLITMKSLPNPSANQVKAIETMLDSIVKKHALNPDIDLAIRLQIAQDMTSILHARIPACKVDVFGSSLTCFGFKSSDVNLDLTLPNDKLTVPEALISIKELLMTNDQCSSVKDEFDLSIPHIFFIHKKSFSMASSVVSLISCHIIHGLYCHAVPRTLHLNQKHGLPCRLCCGCKLACKTSLLLKHYGSLHSFVWPLVVGFRYWAKICSVDSKDGGLPPYCLALMVIQFLQNTSPPMLPLLDTEQEIDGKKFHSKNMSTLGQLWFQLFRYYTIVFQVDEDIISIRVKQPYNREERKWGHRRYAIEDPYITNHNVSTVTSDRVFEYITHCLNTSFIYYGTIPKATSKGVISKTSQSSSIDDDDVEVYEEHGSGSESDLSSNKQDDEAIFQMDDVEDGLSNDMNDLTIASKDPVLVYHMKQDVLSAGKQPEVQCQCCKRDGHVTSDCPELKKPTLKPLPKLSGKMLDLVTRLCAQTRGHVAFAPQEVKFRESVLWNLEDYIQEVFPDARLHLFGSSMNGFGFKDSDLDICMTLDGKEKDDVDCISVIKDLAKKLKQHRDCSNVVAITTAKVPIVKFYLRSVRKEADISLYNVLALENTNMLAMYAKIDDRVSVLGYTLKLFAKLCDIGDASKGSLSSYAYILMLLHYLQRCKVIPVLQELYSQGNKPVKAIDGWNCWFFDDLSNLHKVWKPNNRENVGALWIGFLRYYTEVFDWEHDVVCCRRTKKLTKFEKMWTRHIFAIEDPFNLDHNLGAGISRKMGTFIKTALIRGRERFGSQPHVIPGMHLMQYYFNADYFTDGLDAPSDRTCRVCGHIGHIARECPRLRKNRRDERMDNEERSKLSYRPFAAPNFTPRKRAATAPVTNKQNTANTMAVGSVPNTGDAPGLLPSTVDTPLHVGSLPTNIQHTNKPGQPLAMSPPITAWKPSSNRQRSSSESMADSPPVMPVASPPNVYRRDVPIYPHHIGSPLQIGPQIPMTSQHSPLQIGPQIPMTSQHSPLQIGPQIPMTSQHSPPHFVTKQAVGSPQHHIGSPPLHHIGSPHHVTVAHHISALHQSSPSHHSGSPVQQFMMVSPPNYHLPLSQQLHQQQQQPQQLHQQQQQPQQLHQKLQQPQQLHQHQQPQQLHQHQQQQLQQQKHLSTNQFQSHQDTADKHMTPDEFFSLVREAESKESTKPPELTPHRTIPNAVLGHSKTILSSPKTEDEHKLFSKLDKVRSLWSGDDTPIVAAVDIDSTTKKHGLLGDTPIVAAVDIDSTTKKHGLLGDTPIVAAVDIDSTTKKHGLLGDTPIVAAVGIDGATKKHGLLGDTPIVAAVGIDGTTKKQGLLGDTPLVSSDNTKNHNQPDIVHDAHVGIEPPTNEKDRSQQSEVDLPTVERVPSKKGPHEVHHEKVKAPTKKGNKRNKQQVKSNSPEEETKTQPGQDLSKGGSGAQYRTSNNEKGLRNTPKKEPREGAGTTYKKDEATLSSQKRPLDEGSKTPGKKRTPEGGKQQQKKNSREEGARTPSRKYPREEGTMTPPNKGPREEGTRASQDKGPVENSPVTLTKQVSHADGTSYKKQKGESAENPSDGSLQSTGGSKRRQNKRIKHKPLKLSLDDVNEPPPASSSSFVETDKTLATTTNKASIKQTCEGSITTDKHTDTPKREHRQRGRGRRKGDSNVTKTLDDDGCQDAS